MINDGGESSCIVLFRDLKKQKNKTGGRAAGSRRTTRTTDTAVVWTFKEEGRGIFG